MSGKRSREQRKRAESLGMALLERIRPGVTVADVESALSQHLQDDNLWIENQRLKARLKMYEQESDNQQQIGWDACATFVTRHYEPLMHHWSDMEVIIAEMRGMILRNQHKLPKQDLYELALIIGEKLNLADVHNRAMGTRTPSGYWIDFTVAHNIRAAILDIVNDVDGAEQLLKDLLINNDWRAKRAENLEVLYHRRDRPREENTVQLGQRVKEYKVSHPNWTIRKCAQAVLADIGGGWTEDTLVTYYHRVKNDS